MVREYHKIEIKHLHEGRKGKTKMEKLIALASIALIALTSVFATATPVEIRGAYPETLHTLALKYDGTAVTDNQAISDNGTVFNLKNAGTTKAFTVHASGNTFSTVETLELEVEVGEFTNEAYETVDNNIRAVGVASSTAIPSGYINDKVIESFTIAWDAPASGSAINAGNYTSEVKITFSVAQ